MKNFYNRMRNFKLPKRAALNSAILSFSKKERIIFIVLVVILVISTVSILQSINKSFMVNIPRHGGAVSEGIIGTPRFINPILAFSDADLNLLSLIYSGLMRKTADGALVPDLAEKYEMSPDGLNYTFTLKNGITFQDGKPVTADDVVFTINEIKDPLIKSSRKINWDGVIIEKIDSKTVKFTLKQPYASFLDNATLGIMPAHIWAGTPMELNDANTNPIGSGPFMINKTNKQSSGVIDYYELVTFEKFALGEPYLKTISLHFYSNEDDLLRALESKTIDQVSSITPLNAENLKERNYKIESSVLPRVFGLFFNQNVNRFFVDKTIVKAIDQAIDKDKIVRDVLFGYGVAIDDPIPPNMLEYQTLKNSSPSSREEGLKKVQADLAKDGWKAGTDGILEKTATINKKKTTTRLEFSISTGNAPELQKAAELIKEDLSAIGIGVDVKTFEIGNLNQNVIRPRKYDALLFGEIINQESDLFAFWHSSQRKDPGLNVAMYTNAKVDKLLEDAAVTVDKEARVKKYLEFENNIRADMPAVFLYSPKLIYIVSPGLQQFEMSNIISPADRYLNAHKWYLQTESVWKIFAKNNY